MKKAICCPHCNSNNITKRGFFQTKAHGKQQRYFCKSCNKKFIRRTGFYRMRNSANKITLCLDLFFKGVSTRKVQEHLQAFYPHNSSHMTIYRWIVKYSKMIGKFTDKLKLNVGNELQIDEMEYHRLGNKNWFIDCIDTETRYLVSSEYRSKRSEEDIKIVLRIAKYKTDNKTTIVQTDGWGAYRKSLNKTFGLHKRKAISKIIHRKLNASKGDGFNCRIERLHNSIRERTKTFRGFHGSVESAYAIMKGYEIFYNFIRKHQAIGKCPYEVATDIKLNNPNKWVELIELSKNGE
tara:strand:+ start:43 stop:924 length:882 start_codon:yes stop_codon:yes gene_type:complete